MAYIDVSFHTGVFVRLSDDLAVDFGSCFWRHCGDGGWGLQFKSRTLWKLDIAVWRVKVQVYYNSTTEEEKRWRTKSKKEQEVNYAWEWGGLYLLRKLNIGTGRRKVS